MNPISSITGSIVRPPSDAGMCAAPTRTPGPVEPVCKEGRGRVGPAATAGTEMSGMANAPIDQLRVAELRSAVREGRYAI